MPDDKTNVDAPGCFYCLNVKPFLRRAWSDATRDHFRNARVELLKGVRSVIDGNPQLTAHFLCRCGRRHGVPPARRWLSASD